MKGDYNRNDRLQNKFSVTTVVLMDRMDRQMTGAVYGSNRIKKVLVASWTDVCRIFYWFESFGWVSVSVRFRRKTLKSLVLNDPLCINMLLSRYCEVREASVYSKYQDGNKHKKIPHAAEGNKLVIHIQLYSYRIVMHWSVKNCWRF